MKKRICIDIDHVLADLIGSWVSKYNKVYGDNLKVSDVTMWDWHVITKPECGKKIYSLLTPDLFEGLDVIEDSQDVVKKLSDHFEIFLVTAARNANVIPAKSRWIRKNFPYLKKDNIVYTVNKSICLADYLIDDKPENLEGFQGKGILFNASHNQDENRFMRVNNWREIESYFSNI